MKALNKVLHFITKKCFQSISSWKAQHYHHSNWTLGRIIKNMCLFNRTISHHHYYKTCWYMCMEKRAYCKVAGEKRNNVQDLCDLWTWRFEVENVSEPQISAELIIAHVLGKKMIHEVPLDLILDNSLISVIDELCKKRLKRMPVQYIIGEWDFQDLVLKMREPVFIPRPETEELADFVCDYIHSNNLVKGKFLEIGCGSGAISLYILKQFQQMTGVAIDKHLHACDLTTENRNILGLENRLMVHQIDIFQKNVLTELQQYAPFHFIVSNPPYIPTSKVSSLDSEVLRYESKDALDGGEDGLDIIRQILELAPQLVLKGGQVWLEVDLEEPEQIKTLLQDSTTIEYLNTYKDFTQRDRFCALKVS